jgi:hypothetical protein
MLANWEYNWQFPWPPVGLQSSGVLNLSGQIAQLQAGDLSVSTDGNVSAGNQLIAKQGFVFITKATTNALFLPLPLYGAPGLGGNDGALLRIISTTAQAHTVTTSQPNGYNASLKTATFGGSAGNAFMCVAYQGSWWVIASNGVTLS